MLALDYLLPEKFLQQGTVTFADVQWKIHLNPEVQ